MDKKINDIIILLCKGISNRRLYFAGHPKVLSYVEAFLRELNGFFQKYERDEFFVGIIEGNFIFNGQRLFGPTVVGRQLIQVMEMLCCGGVSFKRGVTIADIRAFMDLTDSLKKPLNSRQEARELFKKQGIQSIVIAGHYSDQPEPGPVDRARPWEGQETGGFLQSPTLIYQALFDVVTRAHGDATFSRELDIASARSISEFMLRFTQANFAEVMQYIHYPDYDSYTIGHSVRVASIAVYLGMKMNWPKEDILAIGTAGILHDIGKSRIPSEILYKAGALTEDEYGLIKSHPRVGAELLLAQRDVSPLDIAAAWGHHIRHDGKGYPEKPAWAVRSPVVALLQICDVFEALTAVRPYKEVMSPQQAFSAMIADRGAFHPGLLSAFIALIGLYPPGTYVKLSDGRVGMVSGAGESIDRPVVKILRFFDGSRLEEEDRYDVDLGGINRNSLGIRQLLFEYPDAGG